MTKGGAGSNASILNQLQSLNNLQTNMFQNKNTWDMSTTQLGLVQESKKGVSASKTGKLLQHGMDRHNYETIKGRPMYTSATTLRKGYKILEPSEQFNSRESSLESGG